jgi:RNA polymerase sigma-70 factor, ECF subfamily
MICQGIDKGSMEKCGGNGPLLLLHSTLHLLGCMTGKQWSEGCIAVVREDLLLDVVPQIWSVSPRGVDRSHDLFWKDIASSDVQRIEIEIRGAIIDHLVKTPESELCMRLGPVNGQPQERFDFNEYLDGLYGYAMVLSRNSAEAEDLVQETCLRALRAVDRLRAEGSVKSWLFTILRNIWLNELRQRRTVPDLVELDADENGVFEPADATQDPHTDYISKVEREQVRAAIQQLPLEFREIIVLREYEELSYQEIAALLNCPPGTVMSRLARARSKLRELLTQGPMATGLPEKESHETGGTAA